MRFQKRVLAALIVATGASTTVVRAQTATYSYDVGPNYVNMSGSRCRVSWSGTASNLQHSNGRTTVEAGSGNFTALLCPITRRSTSFYQNAVGAPETIASKVTVSALKVRAQKASADPALYCRLFATGSNGSITWGTTRWLCATQGGCTSATAGIGWTGVNTLTWNSAPLGGTLSSVSWGLTCTVPEGSSIHYYQATVTPNPPN